MTPPKILIVEDERVVARDIRRLLEAHGCQITDDVASGAEALESVRRDPPDLVLMDVRLQGEMDGIACAEHIVERHDLPVVFLTAFSDQEVLGRALKTNPYGNLLKPFEGQDLHIAVEFAMHRHHTEQQLRLFRHGLTVASDAIVITDDQGDIVWANAAFSRMTGYSLDEAMGQNPRDLIKSNVQSRDFYKKMWDTLTRGEVWDGELVNRRKDGILYHEHMTITPMFGPRGKATHFFAIKQDISEKKSLEEKFLRAQRLESIGTLAGGIAHDLNNILSPILLSGEYLLKDCKDPVHREVIQVMIDSARRGSEIVKQVLSFARGGGNERGPMQARHIVGEVVRVARETFPRSIRIVENVPRGAWSVNANPTQFHQLLLNLMINARDAMPAGGDLRIEAENVELSEETAETLTQKVPPGPYLLLRVKDTGCGMSEETLGMIFDPFFSTKPGDQGTGLGLATVMGILTVHKAGLRVSSEPGQGTCFELYFPATQKPREPRPASKKNLPRGTGRHILVVDDEESIRWMLRSSLETLDYHVTLANNATDALETLPKLSPPPDLVLMDVMMPGLDGRKAAHNLRETHPDLPIILMSGILANKSDTARIETGEEFPFLQKPFTIQELAESVARLAKGKTETKVNSKP